MGYSMIFDTKIVNLSDGRLIHFDRSGGNNDNEGRRLNDWTARIYTQEEFKSRINSFKNSSQPYRESQPGEWELKIFNRMATGYDYGEHLEKMQNRARDYKDFIAEYDIKVKRYDGVELIKPESKMMSYQEYEEYVKNKPIDSHIQYRILSTTIDLNNEEEFVKQIESGSPIEVYIGDMIPVHSQVAEEPDIEEEEDMGMNIGM